MIQSIKLFFQKQQFLIILFLSILLNFLLLKILWQNKFSHGLTFLYLLSITLPASYFYKKYQLHDQKANQLKWYEYAILLLPVIIRILTFNIEYYHGDEFLTAYFSDHLDLKTFNIFNPVPSNRSDWVCQFPSLFFIFQKIFFLFFGANVLTIKYSVLIYVFIVSLFLYKTVILIFKEKILAMVSVILYSFFAISLYLETRGLHFISSTAVFMAAFYYLMLLTEKKAQLWHLFLVGFFTALCYLFYSSSYLALIIFLFIFVSESIFQKKIFIKEFLIFLLAFYLTISPFIIYMLREKTNYLTQRYDQISLLSGEWSGNQKKEKNLATIYELVKTNLLLDIQSLYTVGIGGHGGYDFGKLAFFEKYSWYIFFASMIIALFLSFKKRIVFYSLMIIILTFFTGMGLTIPPPAFHRFSLAIPIICLIMICPFYLINLIIKKHLWKISFFIILLAFYIFNNLIYFDEANLRDKNPFYYDLSQMIKKRFSDKNVYLAAFPNHALPNILYFFGEGNLKTVKTDYHHNYLDNFQKFDDPKSVFLIIFPEVFNQQFQEKQASFTLENINNEYSIFYYTTN